MQTQVSVGSLHGVERFSGEHIMLGLRLLFEPYLEDTPLDADTVVADIWAQLDDAFVYDLADEYEQESSLEAMRLFFGVEFDAEMWRLRVIEKIRSAKPLPQNCHTALTVGELAALIRERIDAAAFEPITILGSKSDSAAAFRVLEQMVKEHKPKVRRFGPSTPIVKRIKGEQLRFLWQRLRWLSMGRVPPLEVPPVTRADPKIAPILGLGLAASVAVVIMAATSSWPARMAILFGALFTFVAVLATTLVLCLISQMGHNAEYCVQKNIRTFGDLARLVAGEHGGFCAECGYNLTGNESGKCPECGRVRTATATS